MSADFLEIGVEISKGVDVCMYFLAFSAERAWKQGHFISNEQTSGPLVSKYHFPVEGIRSPSGNC